MKQKNVDTKSGLIEIDVESMFGKGKINRIGGRYRTRYVIMEDD